MTCWNGKRKLMAVGKMSTSKPRTVLITSGTTVIKMAPNMDPRMLPMPPTIIIARYRTLSNRGKCSGVTVFKKFTQRHPEIPAMNELTAKA